MKIFSCNKKYHSS